jgi:hypothetical protein
MAPEVVQKQYEPQGNIGLVKLSEDDFLISSSIQADIWSIGIPATAGPRESSVFERSTLLKS